MPRHWKLPCDELVVGLLQMIDVCAEIPLGFRRRTQETSNSMRSLYLDNQITCLSRCAVLSWVASIRALLHNERRGHGQIRKATAKTAIKMMRREILLFLWSTTSNTHVPGTATTLHLPAGGARRQPHRDWRGCACWWSPTASREPVKEQQEFP